MTEAPGPVTLEPIRMRGAAATHPGRVREHNEDAALVRDDAALWAVADGMGGHSRGDFASALVVDHLRRLPRDGDPRERLRALVAGVEQANAALRAEAARVGAEAIGSTLVLFMAAGRRGLFAWIGDSRGYVLRDGALRQATRDHSVVQELVERGRLSEAEAEAHPHAHVLTRAIGAADSAEFDFAQIDLRRGDRILLCSDGLTREVRPERLRDILAAAPDAQGACAELVEAALAGGGRDNVTAVVVDLA